MSNLNLKGIWILIELLIDNNLSDKEKLIYSIILLLSKENDYCNKTGFKTNKLIKEECIDIIIKYKENSKEIEIRKLIPKKEMSYLTKVKYPLQQNFNTLIEEKFKYNSNNNFDKRNKANFEQRYYTSIDLISLYANVLVYIIVFA